MPYRNDWFMQHVVAALSKSREKRLHIHCTNTEKFSLESVLIKYNLCGMKCWCFHTIIETHWILFIKIHNLIRKILLLLKCKSHPPPMIKSFCTGVKHRTAAGSTDGQVLSEHMFKSQATKKIPDTPRRHRSRNDTAPGLLPCWVCCFLASLLHGIHQQHFAASPFQPQCL